MSSIFDIRVDADPPKALSDFAEWLVTHDFEIRAKQHSPSPNSSLYYRFENYPISFEIVRDRNEWSIGIDIALQGEKYPIDSWLAAFTDRTWDDSLMLEERLDLLKSNLPAIREFVLTRFYDVPNRISLSGLDRKPLALDPRRVIT